MRIDAAGHEGSRKGGRLINIIAAARRGNIHFMQGPTRAERMLGVSAKGGAKKMQISVNKSVNHQTKSGTFSIHHSPSKANCLHGSCFPIGPDVSMRGRGLFFFLFL